MPLVVIRHLPGSRPVTLCIINESTDSDVTDQEHYFHYSMFAAGTLLLSGCS